MNKKIALLGIGIIICSLSFAQKGQQTIDGDALAKKIEASKASLAETQRKTDSLMQAQSIQKMNDNSYQWITRYQEEQRRKQKKQAMIRIGIGVGFLAILIIGLARKRKQKIS